MVNRLMEKCHSTAARRPFLVFGIFAASDDNDWNLSRCIQPMEPFHNTKTVPWHAIHGWGETDVEQNQIRIFLARSGDGFGPIQRRKDLIASPLQFQRNCFKDDLVIIHH